VRIIFDTARAKKSRGGGQSGLMKGGR
jgi:hypothetical protein